MVKGKTCYSTYHLARLEIYQDGCDSVHIGIKVLFSQTISQNKPDLFLYFYHFPEIVAIESQAKRKSIEILIEFKSCVYGKFSQLEITRLKTLHS